MALPTNKKAKTKAYLTPSEVAELLMVSPITVRLWATKGLLKAQITPGGHRRFLRHDVERFAREHESTLLPADSNVLKVLVVDDDTAVAGYLQEFLESLDREITVEIAHDGFSAGQQVQSFEPNIVLLDLMMPGLDGFGVCQQLKENPATKAIRIVAMTGYANKENVDRILSAGAETCLKKPIDTALLKETLGLDT